jgi:hypothetical protein
MLVWFFVSSSSLQLLTLSHHLPLSSDFPFLFHFNSALLLDTHLDQPRDNLAGLVDCLYLDIVTVGCLPFVVQCLSILMKFIESGVKLGYGV